MRYAAYFTEEGSKLWLWVSMWCCDSKEGKTFYFHHVFMNSRLRQTKKSCVFAHMSEQTHNVFHGTSTFTRSNCISYTIYCVNFLCVVLRVAFEIPWVSYNSSPVFTDPRCQHIVNALASVQRHTDFIIWMIAHSWTALWRCVKSPWCWGEDGRDALLIYFYRVA